MYMCFSRMEHGREGSSPLLRGSGTSSSAGPITCRESPRAAMARARIDGCKIKSNT